MDKDVPFLCVLQTLEDINDLELTILKCHLLIEGALTDVIVSKAESPKYIMEARLTFSNKHQLARAMYDGACESWVWAAISMLNKTRNRLAHNLTSKNVEDDINKFVFFVKENQPMWGGDVLSVKHRDFFWAVFVVLKAVRDIVDIE
ncbi:hypothetical protein MK852_16145 [Shewanella benthica]|uniref:hypothetical protein n=1 Tax=Shewanella benthica TaxID=43661 RepID=UPI00187AA5B0|nr:hypothetical protein [Shewanella benthica]MBE7215950.1 hypothetical protein [Shewanella benthica]MCL1063642.1 hypothetical protein [Shewanella benthica]